MSYSEVIDKLKNEIESGKAIVRDKIMDNKKFKKMGLKKIMKWGKKECKFFDIKNFLVKNDQNFK